MRNSEGCGAFKKNFQEKYEPKVEFSKGVRGSNQKSSLLGSILDIFWNNTMFNAFYLGVKVNGLKNEEYIK